MMGNREQGELKVLQRKQKGEKEMEGENKSDCVFNQVDVSHFPGLRFISH